MEIGITPSSRTQQLFRRVDDSWFMYFVTVPKGDLLGVRSIALHLQTLQHLPEQPLTAMNLENFVLPESDSGSPMLKCPHFICHSK